jgi:hypothetical protein
MVQGAYVIYGSPTPSFIGRCGGPTLGQRQQRPATAKQASCKPTVSASHGRQAKAVSEGFCCQQGWCLRGSSALRHITAMARETGGSNAGVHEGARSPDPTHATRNASCVAFAAYCGVHGCAVAALRRAAARRMRILRRRGVVLRLRHHATGPKPGAIAG